jgi:hypothetical protein
MTAAAAAVMALPLPRAVAGSAGTPADYERNRNYADGAHLCAPGALLVDELFSQDDGNGDSATAMLAIRAFLVQCTG